MAKLISSQSNGPLSRPEKEAGRELRTIDRQITQFKKSIQRAKNLSNINPKTENSNLVQVLGQKCLSLKFPQFGCSNMIFLTRIKGKVVSLSWNGNEAPCGILRPN